MDPVITVHAYLRSHPDHRDAYREGLRALRAATLEHDAGCLDYRFWQSIDDPDAFVCVEAWTDMDALRAHLAAPHHVALSAALDAHRGAPADVQVFTSSPAAL
ncbi:antibiotic biosynthesis monooxygenase [Glycomyces sp. A-F 0318]|uniref:putative quinol monooxygenase n=1 Tax=Glycomyces amatae TaxID=2881355 RepID=UPI001E537F3F|nr:antibiotic biosynthesis monooxygenase [Glycomyces amatae]